MSDDSNGNGGVKRFAHIPGVTACTMKLIDRLKDGEPGDTFTDEELTKVGGRETKVGGNGYNNLMSALRYCVRHGVRWDRVREENRIRCLDDEERLVASHRDTHITHRRANRDLQKLRTVNPENLPEAKRPDFNALVAQQGTIAAFSSGKTTKRMMAKNVGESFDPKKLLEALN